jgi:hypothetical protein
VYGDGHGAAARWIHVYRRILRAGKSAHVLAADAADPLAVLEEVGPRGVWIQVLRPFDSVPEAKQFIKDVERTSARVRNRVTYESAATTHGAAVPSFA